MADLAARAPGAVVLTASAGDVLFRVDDACHRFIALRSGSLRVGLTSAAGRELVLYRVRPGEICLQTVSCLTRQGAYAAEGIAETDLDAVLIPPLAFDQLMSQDQAFRSVVLSSVASRFMDLEALVETLAFTGLPARLAGALLANGAGSGVVRMTHEDLAAEIGSAREAVSRQLAVFAHADLEQISISLARIRRRRSSWRIPGVCRCR